MQNEIRRYPVQHSHLKKYIKFFWELSIEHAQLNHKLIPQRNINLRFNLSETPQYLRLEEKNYLLEQTFFSGLQDHFLDAHIKLTGKVHILGVCFHSDGFYPFIKTPVSELKNQILGADETGLKWATSIRERLLEENNIEQRLNLLESELLLLLDNSYFESDSFTRIFNTLKQSNNSLQISEFCTRNNIGVRSLERMFNKYIGVSANTFSTLNRFHTSLNQLLNNDYSKLSDIAYGNDYFDQMHFIRDFKRFAGNTPKTFVLEKKSILQIGKLI